jgi:hypothetical protein
MILDWGGAVAPRRLVVLVLGLSLIAAPAHAKVRPWREPANPVGVISPTGDAGAAIVADGGYNAFPVVTRSADATLHLVYRASVDHNSTRIGTLVYRTSTDDGATWTYPRVLVSDFENVRLTSPWITSTSTGRLIFGYTYKTGDDHRHIVTLLSSDHGATWSPGPEIHHWDYRTATSGPAIEPEAGTLWRPIYGRNAAEATYSAGYLVSTDDGLSWPTYVPLASSATAPVDWEEPFIQKVDKGYLALLRVDDDRTIRVSKSKDGRLWSSPQLAFGGWGSPAIARLGSGRLVATSRDPVDSHSFAAFSDDNGTTWAHLADLSPNVYEYATWASPDPRQGGAQWILIHSMERSLSTADIYLTNVYDRFR